MLLKIQRNELFNILQNLSIPITSVEEIKKINSYSIKALGDTNHFTITLNTSALGGEFSVESVPYSLGVSWGGMGYSWSNVVAGFDKWAQGIRSELDTPDLWAEAAKTAQLFVPSAEPTDDKFTRTELAEVQGQLRLLQQSFAAAALPEAARQKLIDLTHTAAEKAEGFTEKDWQGWFIGSLISTITGLAFNPTQAAEVYKLVKAAFGGLFLH